MTIESTLSGSVRPASPRPRFDLHRLALYAAASHADRRQILLAEKYPSPFRPTGEQARSLAVDGLRLGWDAERLFGAASARLSWGMLGADLPSLRRRQSIDALVRVGEMLGEIRAWIERREAQLSLCHRILDPFELAGIDVTAQPDAILVRRGRSASGLMAIHISALWPHTVESARIAAALLVELARINVSGSGEIAGELCAVIDPFAGAIVDASGDSRRRIERAGEAATEIAQRWESSSWME